MLSTFFNVLCCDPINKNCIDSWNESWLKKIIRLREFFGERCVSEQTFFFRNFSVSMTFRSIKKRGRNSRWGKESFSVRNVGIIKAKTCSSRDTQRKNVVELKKEWRWHYTRHKWPHQFPPPSTSLASHDASLLHTKIFLVSDVENI